MESYVLLWDSPYVVIATAIAAMTAAEHQMAVFWIFLTRLNKQVYDLTTLRYLHANKHTKHENTYVFFLSYT